MCIRIINDIRNVEISVLPDYRKEDFMKYINNNPSILLL